MKSVAAVILFILSFHFSSAQDVDLTWLTGTWKVKGKPSFEVWHRNSNGTLSGKAFRIQSGDTLITETITLKYFDGSFHYIPDIAGDQGPVDFVMTSLTSKGFVAENPRHDFPKIIRYRYSGDGDRPTLEATIEGNGKVIPYSFEKVK